MNTLEFRNMKINRPPTKLQEGNVFTGVCLFTGGCPHVTITHDALDLAVQNLMPLPPSLGPGYPEYGTPLYMDPPAHLSDMASHCRGIIF